MLRRVPETILIAHRMDPGRRELYVEGVRDRVFLNWLVGDGLGLRSAVVPIELVDLPNVDEGGNRERLKRFLHWLSKNLPRSGACWMRINIHLSMRLCRLMRGLRIFAMQKGTF